jgi:hypothetical protein
LKARLAEMTKKLIEPKADETPAPQLPVPASVPSQTLPDSSSLPQPIAGSEPTSDNGLDHRYPD